MKWIVLIIFLSGMLGFAAMLGSGEFRTAEEMPRDEACAGNMRVLREAIVLYNQDHFPAVLDSLAACGNVFATGSVLVEQKYLKSVISKPMPGCDYTSTNLLTNGEIRCVVHGTETELGLAVSQRKSGIVYRLKRFAAWLARRLTGFR